MNNRDIKTPEFAATTELRECDKHGMQHHKVIKLLNNSIYKCPECQKEEEAEQAEIEKKKEQFRKREEKRLKNAQITERLESSGVSKRFSGLGFDSFIADSDKKKKALNAVKKFAESFDKAIGIGYNMMLIGNYGNGKTHLACAAVQCVIKQGYTAKIISLTKLIRSYRETWVKENDDTEQAFMDRCVKLDLLVIDEAGVQYGSDSERIIISEIINERYANMKPTIIISNLDIEGMKETLGARVVERMNHNGSVIVFNWDSLRK